MSESKLVMVRKLSKVQSALMGMSFEDTNLHTILPIIFEECLKENLTFWFNFIENTCVLNLRDTYSDNYELNIRQYIGNIEDIDYSSIKRQVLCNAFLLTVDAHPIQNMNSTQEDKQKTGRIQDALKKVTEKDKPKIQESKIVPPSPIRLAIEVCKKNGEPITKKSIENKLNLKGMSQDKRRQCIAYLKDMGD